MRAGSMRVSAAVSTVIRVPRGAELARQTDPEGNRIFTGLCIARQCYLRASENGSPVLSPAYAGGKNGINCLQWRKSCEFSPLF